LLLLLQRKVVVHLRLLVVLVARVDFGALMMLMDLAPGSASILLVLCMLLHLVSIVELLLHLLHLAEILAEQVQRRI